MKKSNEERKKLTAKDIIEKTLKILLVAFGSAIFTVGYFMVIPATVFKVLPIDMNYMNINIIEAVLVVLLIFSAIGIKFILKRKTAK